MSNPYVAEPLLRALQSAKLSSDQFESVLRILRAEIAISENAVHLLEHFDTGDKKNWSVVIALARRANISDGEMQHELGASPSTIHRWLKEGVAPREGTRRLMRGALLALARQKVQHLKYMEGKFAPRAARPKSRARTPSVADNSLVEAGV